MKKMEKVETVDDFAALLIERLQFMLAGQPVPDDGYNPALWLTLPVDSSSPTVLSNGESFAIRLTVEQVARLFEKLR